ncbi:MAG: hypothetical protein ABH815_04670 [Candidatus Omnitrophota bacterium]
MDKNKKKNIELNAAIGIAVILLVTVVFIFARNSGRQENTLPLAEKKGLSPKQENLTILKSQFTESEFEATAPEAIKEKIKAAEKEPRPEKEIPELMSLDDIPLDSIQPGVDASQKQKLQETTGVEETWEPSFNTQPSVEDIKKLQKKGLVIY